MEDNLSVTKRIKRKKYNSSYPDFSGEGHFSEIRRIQNKILDLHIGENYKTFLFASPHLQCGTSTILSQIAFSLAREIDVKILVLDFNTRDPGGLHKIFNARVGRNVSTEFIDSAPIGELVTKTEYKDIDLFSLLSVPDYSPGDYSYDLIIDFLFNARENYDFVLLDMPPIDVKNRHAMDTPSISRLVDGVILVARWRVTKMKQLQEARDELEDFKANILGVIVNQYK